MKITLRKSLFLLALLALLLNVLCVYKITASAQTDGRYSETYGGATPYATIISEETVEYTRREVETLQIENALPFYTANTGMENGCGAVAGSIVIGFYDKYYEELIPNYSTSLSTGKFKIKDRTYIPQLMNELYTLMRTNVDDVGVSESDCLNGLKAYVQSKNRNIAYTNIRNNSTVDETLFRNAVNTKKPVLLFCNRTDAYKIASSSNSDSITGTNLTSVGHIVVAYGLYTVKYYNAGGLFRTDKYINIETGLSTSSTYLLKIDSTGWSDGAYAVSVN